jgi:hypothetical protein
MNATTTSTPKTICVKCNKFFGSEETLGFCSQCFKIEGGSKKMSFDSLSREENSVVKNSVEANVEVNSKPVQTNKMNCWKCEKRVGYLGFTCKCKYIFCSTHRHGEDHECDFDFKANCKKTEDFVVESKKLNKI